jgi:hypothetical protein
MAGYARPSTASEYRKQAAAAKAVVPSVLGAARLFNLPQQKYYGQAGIAGQCQFRTNQGDHIQSG